MKTLKNEILCKANNNKNGLKQVNNKAKYNLQQEKGINKTTPKPRE